MKFLIDAQLPRRLARALVNQGHDAIHTLDLPDANRTSDARIIEIANEEERVVVSKDADFVDSYYLHGKPHRLLLISTGNIRNDALQTLLISNLELLVLAFETAGIVELTSTAVIVHE